MFNRINHCDWLVKQSFLPNEAALPAVLRSPHLMRMSSPAVPVSFPRHYIIVCVCPQLRGCMGFRIHITATVTSSWNINYIEYIAALGQKPSNSAFQLVMYFHNVMCPLHPLHWENAPVRIGMLSFKWLLKLCLVCLETNILSSCPGDVTYCTVSLGKRFIWHEVL